MNFSVHTTGMENCDILSLKVFCGSPPLPILPAYPKNGDWQWERNARMEGDGPGKLLMGSQKGSQ